MSRSSLMPACCVVTGCAGNVGSKLTKVLLDRGAMVVGVDNFFSGLKENILQFKDNERFHLVERSIVEPGLLTSLAARAQGADCPLYVFHLAAAISVPWSMEHPEETMAVNYEATLALHRQARDLGAKAFVFAGSAAEYGLPLTGAAREEQAGEPQSPYGWSKFESSKAIGDSGFGCSLRFFNLYGPARGEPGPYDGVVRRFLSQALAGQALTIHGRGDQTRDFVFVWDAVSAILTASGLDRGGEGLNGVFNIGTGRSTSVLELAEHILRIAGSDAGVRFVPGRAGDITHSLANAEKFFAATGVRPATPLSRGLELALDWFRGPCGRGEGRLGGPETAGRGLGV